MIGVVPPTIAPTTRDLVSQYTMKKWQVRVLPLFYRLRAPVQGTHLMMSVASLPLPILSAMWRRPDVPGARSNYLIGLILLDAMSNPTDRSSQGEERFDGFQIEHSL